MDWSLVKGVQKMANGANIHEVSQYLQQYVSYWDLLKITDIDTYSSIINIRKVERVLRSFLVTRDLKESVSIVTEALSRER